MIDWEWAPWTKEMLRDAMKRRAAKQTVGAIAKALAVPTEDLNLIFFGGQRPKIVSTTETGSPAPIAAIEEQPAPQQPAPEPPTTGSETLELSQSPEWTGAGQVAVDADLERDEALAEPQFPKLVATTGTEQEARFYLQRDDGRYLDVIGIFFTNDVGAAWRGTAAMVATVRSMRPSLKKLTAVPAR